MWPWCGGRKGVGAPLAPAGYPSLPFVLDEARRSIDAQDRRASNLDQRGGVLVGFAGVLVGVVMSRSAAVGWDAVVATLLAGAAGAIAAYAISLRVANSLGPDALQATAGQPLEDTLLEVAGTMVLLYRRQGRVIGQKSRLLGVASVLVIVAVAVLAVGMVVRSEVVPDAVQRIGEWVTDETSRPSPSP